MNRDDKPRAWFEGAGMWIGAALPFLCIALGLIGPDISPLIFN